MTIMKTSSRTQIVISDTLKFKLMGSKFDFRGARGTLASMQQSAKRSCSYAGDLLQQLPGVMSSK